MDDEFISLFFLYDKQTKQFKDVATTSRELALNNGVSPSTVRASVHRMEHGIIKNSKYIKQRILKDEILDIYNSLYLIDDILGIEE